MPSLCPDTCILNGRPVTFSIEQKEGRIDPTRLEHPGFSLSFIYNSISYLCYGTDGEKWYHVLSLYKIHKGITDPSDEQFMEDVMRDIIRAIDAAYTLYGSDMHYKLVMDNMDGSLPQTYRQAIVRLALAPMYFYSLGDVLSK